MYKRFYVLASLLIILSLVLGACASTPEVTEEPAMEEAAPVEEEEAAPAEEESAPVEEAAPAEEEMMEEPADPNALPRDETLYYNGLQWGAVVGWNPYSSSNNNAWIAQGAMARVIMFESPYIYDMLDGQVYPLLADGPYAWNDAGTEIWGLTPTGRATVVASS